MDEAQQEPSLDEVAYEQLPASVQRLLDALDGANLMSLPAQRRGLLEAAIRGVLRNARLIAAAPALVETATALREWCDAHLTAAPGYNEVMLALDTALAQAEGRG